MRITSARIFLIRAGTLHPVLVEIGTDDGIVGIGEAGIAYGVGATATAGMVKDLVETMVLGRDPFRIEEIWSEMYDHSFWAKGGGPIIFAGISAIEQALWDIKGKVLNVPVYEFLGGRFRDRVRLYANGWSYAATTPDEYARAAERVVADGYTALKCYPLSSPNGRGGIRHVSRRTVDRTASDVAFARVKATRQAVGPGVDLMVDLSGGLTTGETIRLCRRLADLDILFIEEPVDPFDLGALREVANHVDVPLALGERVYTRQGFRAALQTRAVDLVQPDIGNTGGIMETKKIAAIAEAYNVRVQLHVCGSPVATAAALQLDACIANFAIHEIYPYRPAEHFAIVEDAPEHAVRDGHMPIPSRPGIGITLIEERVRPFLWAECRAEGPGPRG
jgi:galactonate dehydratase